MIAMEQLTKKEFKYYANFLKRLAKDMTRFYNLKLNKPFKVINKSKGKGYDPVTKADRAFEKFIRSKIQKKFPKHEIIGDVRHKGLIFAVELVTNRAEKTPATKEAGKIVNAMCREGVLISRIGTHDSVLKVRPPMVFEREHADLLIEKLDTCISEGGN